MIPLGIGLGLIPILISLYIFRKKLMTKKAKKAQISVQFPIEEYNRIRTWAVQNGRTLSDYVRQVVVSSLPPESESNPEADAVLEQAFEELDKTEGSGIVLGPPPARRPQVGVVAESEQSHPLQRVLKVGRAATPKAPPGKHPCMYLSPAIPRNMVGQCQGTCKSPQQSGRVCFWPPTSAAQCPFFENPTSRAAARRSAS